MSEPINYEKVLKFFTSSTTCRFLERQRNAITRISKLQSVGYYFCDLKNIGKIISILNFTV